MKLGTIKTIVKEELSRFGQLPGWMDPLLQTLNNFITNVTQALRGSLTFQDNFLCKIKQIRLAHGVESEINPDSRLKVSGVACFNCNGLIIDKFGWRQLSNGNIGVTIYYDSGTNALCEIIIFLG
jgi:hypothetical protein